MVLNGYRCNILTARRDNQLLYAACDFQELTVVNSTLITSSEVAIIVDAFEGCLIVFQITHHDMSSFNSDFTFAFFVWVGDLHMAASY